MKINFIIPYFGTFPNYMQLYLNSCGKNPMFNWTIITDNETEYDYPKNVRVINKSFEDVQKLVQSKFDFEVALKKPYKLCDMKPMYGYIFEEYNSGFDFWGFCDVDVILGNLSHFITNEVLEYDKIFTQGHMTLMRNTKKLNHLFMTAVDGQLYFKTVLRSEKSFNFDEEFLDKININTICRQEGINIWEQEPIADIYTKSSNFRRVIRSGVESKSKNYYLWNNGKLTRQIKVGMEWKTEEYMYLHLQKRRMKININQSENTFKIIPNEFAKLEINIKEVGEKDDFVNCKRFNLQYFKIRYRNLKTKIKRRL